MTSRPSPGSRPGAKEKGNSPCVERSAFHFTLDLIRGGRAARHAPSIFRTPNRDNNYRFHRETDEEGGELTREALHTGRISTDGV